MAGKRTRTVDREYLRAWLEIDGLRICRDLTVTRGPNKGQLIPQHVAVITHTGDIEWQSHVEGAVVPTVRVMEDYA